jgi:hypothetical protein
MCALVVGLSLPTAHFGVLRISVFWPLNTPSWSFIANYALVCLGSYVVTAILLCLFQYVRDSGFSWLWLSIGGSFVLAMVYTFHRLPIFEVGIYELVFVHFRDALGTTFWLSVFTSPISAVIHDSVWFFNAWRIQQIVGPERGGACFVT